jgi:hypothetical protein
MLLSAYISIYSSIRIMLTFGTKDDAVWKRTYYAYFPLNTSLYED